MRLDYQQMEVQEKIILEVSLEKWRYRSKLQCRESLNMTWGSHGGDYEDGRLQIVSIKNNKIFQDRTLL
jgi:hypothetical protein